MASRITTPQATVDDTFPLVTGEVTPREAASRLGGLAGGVTLLSASARARAAYADLVTSAVPFHVGVAGDSIVTGYNATDTGGFSWVEIMRARLKEAFGLPAGTIGHRVATTLGYLAPRFVIGASDPALSAIGRATTDNAPFVQAVYDVAADVGAWPVPCHEVVGDGSVDAHGLFHVDGIHLVDLGHRVLGEYMASAVEQFLRGAA